MCLYFKNIFVCLFFCLFLQQLVSAKTTLSNTLVTETTFKNWVNQVKKQLKLSKKRKINFGNFLLKFDRQLKKMTVNTKLNKKNSTFLLNFQLSSFKDLFPLLFVLKKKTTLKKNCSYLRQKIIHDLYPTYENTKTIKLPYAHKELNQILNILCY